MGNPFKIMIMGYLLPLLAAGIVVLIPEYDGAYLKWLIAIFTILLVMPIVYVLRFPRKKEKSYRLTLMYQLYAFTFIMTFPLLKVLKGYVVFQLLLIAMFIGCYFLARFDQQTKVPVVYPDGNKRRKRIAYVYYALPYLLIVLGFGGDYVKTRVFFEIFGDKIMMPYLAIIIYLLCCWLIFLLSSLAYKSHVKEGYLEK